MPCGCPGQQQVGDVGARDQQHEGHRAGQDEERRPHVTGQLIAQRDDARRPAGVEVGKHPRQLGRNVSHVELRLLDGHARLQPSDNHERPATRRSRLRREADRQPHVDALVEKREAGRHDADDGVRRALRHQRFVEDSRIGAEAAFPQSIADDDRSGPGDVLRGGESTSTSRLHAENLEELGRDGLRLQLLGLAAPRDGDAVGDADRGEILERPGSSRASG